MAGVRFTRLNSCTAVDEHGRVDVDAFEDRRHLDQNVRFVLGGAVAAGGEGHGVGEIAAGAGALS